MTTKTHQQMLKTMATGPAQGETFKAGISRDQESHRREQEQGQEIPQDPEGLWTLPYYANLRRTASKVERNPSGNVDFVSHPDLQGEVPICHFDALVGFTNRDGEPRIRSSQRGGIIAMATHHLNIGYSKIIPDLEGLPDRCPIRFTVEAASTQLSGSTALEVLKEHVGRLEDPSSEEPAPCVVLGNTYSSVSRLTSTITGFLQIPQISASATSPSLDDPIVYPLFGRPVPSDQGIAVTTLQFFSQVLGAKHMNIVHVNDDVQNNMVESIRQAIPLYAPEMILHQVVMSSESPIAELEAIKSLKLSRYRHTLCLVHNDEITELYKQAVRNGMAGDGLHQWFFVSDSAPTSILADDHLKGSELYNFFNGIGEIRLFSGGPGMPAFDALTEDARALTRVPANRPILENFFKTVYDQDYIENSIFGPEYMQGSAIAVYEPFVYDTVVAAGLAACKAWELKGQNASFTGADHFDAFKQSSFRGVTGNIAIDNVTGTRNPVSAFYQVVNFRPEQAENEDGQKIPGQYSFEPFFTHTYEDGNWVQQQPYIFNDGTSNIPIDVGPPPLPVDDNLSTEGMVGIIVSAVALVLIIVYIGSLWRKRMNDMLWQIAKKELLFDSPVQVLGRGTFGEVLLAEYRGTSVAVKKLREQEEAALEMGHESHQYRGSRSGPTYTYKDKNKNSRTEEDVEYGQSGYGGVSSSSPTSNRTGTHQRALKRDLIYEIRHISKLRHPCVATIMGAVLDTASPMLVMEYMDLGSLYEVIHNPTVYLDGEMIVNILSDVTQGMRFLHSSNPEIIHGDLKAQNVLIDKHFQAKVADFGLSQKTQVVGGTGTPFWMAPELLRGQSTNTRATDIFSFGVLMFEVFAGEEPYEGEKGSEVIAAIKDVHIMKRVALPPNMSEKARSLILDCIEENPKARTSFEEIDSRLKRLDHSALVTTFKKPPKSSNTALPDYVAQTLKQGSRNTRERKTNVCLFACHIAGFDELIQNKCDAQVMSLLSRVQVTLEVLAEQHGVFLLETEGNTFMAASNLGQDKAEHNAMVAFALDAIRLTNKFDDLQMDKNAAGAEVFAGIQAGLHVGNVGTGVLDRKSSRYCLFGEDVMIADLMARRSKMGMIQCSPDAKAVIEKQSIETMLKLRTDGESIKLRFRGKIDTFWLSRKEARHLDTLDRVRANQRIRLNKSIVAAKKEDHGGNTDGIHELQGDLEKRLGRTTKKEEDK